MKIAYILYQEAIVSNRSNGVRSQALTWAAMLRNDGHQVDLINEWDVYDWPSYDIIHVIGNGNFPKLLRRLLPLNKNIFFSPIIDPSPHFNYKREELRRFFYTNPIVSKINKNRILTEQMYKLFKKIYVRSQFEGEHISRVYHLPKEKIELVPLAYSETCTPYDSIGKEPFCLHISSIYQNRKNVIRLILAAKKYGFKLVLAGNKGSDAQYKPIADVIGDSPNIEVLGFISEEQKIDLYKRAKVFALPSISEGVGIVALDAAYYGCEIVITNIPGPKEYYNGKCFEVNPFNVDEIGIAIIAALKGNKSFQPQLAIDIKTKYSWDTICQLLVNSYKNI